MKLLLIDADWLLNQFLSVVFAGAPAWLRSLVGTSMYVGIVLLVLFVLLSLVASASALYGGAQRLPISLQLVLSELCKVRKLILVSCMGGQLSEIHRTA